MVPIRDNNPTTITPYVTYGLIAANVLAFLYEANLPPQQLDGFFHLAAIVPRELTASFAGIPVNQPVPEWATLITSQFLHGGFLHLAGNMFWQGYPSGSFLKIPLFLLWVLVGRSLALWGHTFSASPQPRYSP